MSVTDFSENLSKYTFEKIPGHYAIKIGDRFIAETFNDWYKNTRPNGSIFTVTHITDLNGESKRESSHKKDKITLHNTELNSTVTLTHSTLSKGYGTMWSLVTGEVDQFIAPQRRKSLQIEDIHKVLCKDIKDESKLYDAIIAIARIMGATVIELHEEGNTDIVFANDDSLNYQDLFIPLQYR